MTREFSDKQLDAIGAGLKAGEPVEKVLANLPQGPKKKPPRRNEESRAQRQVIRWWDLSGCRVHKLNPCLLHSVPNGGFRSVVTSAIMKAEGQKRGVMDIKLNVSRNGYHGAWIEMKAKNGLLSKEQIEFKMAVEKQGYFTAVCYSANEAIDVIEKYLKS